jgi:hypothetical protein
MLHAIRPLLLLIGTILQSNCLQLNLALLEVFEQVRHLIVLCCVLGLDLRLRLVRLPEMRVSSILI